MTAAAFMSNAGWLFTFILYAIVYTVAVGAYLKHAYEKQYEPRIDLLSKGYQEAQIEIARLRATRRLFRDRLRQHDPDYNPLDPFYNSPDWDEPAETDPEPSLTPNELSAMMEPPTSQYGPDDYEYE